MAIVHAADVQDRDGGVLLMAALFGLFPFLRKLYADGGYQGPVFRNALGTGPGQHPKAEALLSRQVCLPMHACVSDAQAERSVAALRRALDG